MRIWLAIPVLFASAAGAQADELARPKAGSNELAVSGWRDMGNGLHMGTWLRFGYGERTLRIQYLNSNRGGGGRVWRASATQPLRQHTKLPEYIHDDIWRNRHAWREWLYLRTLQTVLSSRSLRSRNSRGSGLPNRLPRPEVIRA